MPRRSWSCGLQRESDLSEQVASGQAAAKARANARDGFNDAGAELEEPKPQRGELGVAKMIGFGHRLGQGEHEPVCGGVQDEAHLVSNR